MANIKICDELQIGKKSPNIDARYGPWQSKGEAVTTLSKWGTIAKGLTVGIIENNKIVEYWFQGGTDLDHLVLKNNGGGGSGSIEGAELQANKVTSIRTDINEPEDSPTAPSNDKYPSERAVALLYNNLETDVTEINRKIGDLSHFQDNQDYNPDPDNLNVGDILKGLETKIIEFNWALEGTDADKDSNVFNNTPYSGYSVWKVLGELYNAVQKKKYNVSFTVENGSKDPNNNYTNVPEGDTIEWVVTPYVNHKMPFRIDGAVIEDLNNGTYKVTVSDIQEDTEIFCECTPIEQPITTHSVTISVNNGTVNGESQKVFHVEHNSGISCVLEANEYYHIPTSLPYSHMSISDTGILSITNVTADIEITIDCIKNKYTVTLNISNGTTTSDNPQQVDAFGSAVFNLTADQYYELPAKTSNNIAIVNGVLTVNNIISDQTISVVCKVKDCFVVFNLDGGTGDTPGALHVDANTSIPLPIYNGTKDGYSLTDSDNRSYWIIVDTAGAHEVQMGGDYTIISDTTIKPKWLTSNDVTVTFDMQNPEYENPESVTVEKNTTITLPFPGGPYTPVKAIGDRNTLCIINWSEVQSNNPYVRPYYLPGASYTATKNITLYAATQVMWNHDLRIYAYAEPGDRSGEADIEEYPMYHSNYTVPQCTFTPPDGKVFDKWYFDNGFGQKGYKNPGDIIEKIDVWWALWAVWKDDPNRVTLTFVVPNAEEATPESITVDKGTTVKLPLAKWNVLKTIDEEQYQRLYFIAWTTDSNASFTSTPAYNGGSNFRVNQNTTLYAISQQYDDAWIWMASNTEDSVLYNPDRIEVRNPYHGKYTIPECPYEAPIGKTFDKWAYNDNSGTNILDQPNTVFKNPGDIIETYLNTYLAAVWKEGDYKAYYLTNELPTEVPTFSKAFTDSMKLGELEGFSNWKNQDNQYIVFPVQSGKTNVSDYFTLTDMFGGNLEEDFNITSTSVPNLGNKIIVLRWNWNVPLSEDDGATATIEFK